MGVISSLTIAGLSHVDGVTARSHTFIKEFNVPNGIKLRDTSEADFSLAPRLVMTAKPPTGVSKIIREKTVFTVPYKDPVTGLLAGTITRTIEDLVPIATPTNVRKDATTTFTNLAAAAQFTAVLRDADFAS